MVGVGGGEGQRENKKNITSFSFVIWPMSAKDQRKCHKKHILVAKNVLIRNSIWSL